MKHKWMTKVVDAFSIYDEPILDKDGALSTCKQVQSMMVLDIIGWGKGCTVKCSCILMYQLNEWKRLTTL